MTLWIDALCIDQGRLVERNAQVARMGEIYQNSDNVLIWLGPESKDGLLALSTISRVYMEYQKRCGQLKDSDEAIRNMVDDPSWIHDGSEILKDDENDGEGRFKRSKPWAALWVLFHQRTWFRRVWIVQEVCPLQISNKVKLLRFKG
jgi:hypothetical protein